MFTSSKVKIGGLPLWVRGKNPPANAGDLTLLPNLERFHTSQSNQTRVLQLFSRCCRAQELHHLSLQAAAIEGRMHRAHLLPSIVPSIRVSTCHIRWPKYQSFSISASNEYSGSTSLRSDWFDFLAVQETLSESSPIPQFKSINSSLLNLLHGPVLISVHNYCKIEFFFFSYFLFYTGV